MTDELPDGLVARIDITAKGIRFHLSKAVPVPDMVETLRMLADALEDGSLQQVLHPAEEHSHD
jgi:hypothetical protein